VYSLVTESGNSEEPTKLSGSVRLALLSCDPACDLRFPTRFILHSRDRVSKSVAS
jgi:hypothetical protein